jgi:hypothetical protein
MKLRMILLTKLSEREIYLRLWEIEIVRYRISNPC